MRAAVGDRVTVPGRRTGDPVRVGEVIEVHDAEGRPPYVIRWSADGHLGLFIPGPDAQVQPGEPKSTQTREVAVRVTADGGFVHETAPPGATQIPDQRQADVDVKSTQSSGGPARRI